MSKVVPVVGDEPFAFTTFTKPVPCGTQDPLTAYDPAYVARKKEVGEKILTLKNGRHLAYFTEGDPADPAVLCLHSLGQCKTEWLFPKPLPGVFLIAVDRQPRLVEPISTGKPHFEAKVQRRLPRVCGASGLTQCR